MGVSTMADIIVALAAGFPGAEIRKSVKPADWTGDEVHWVRVETQLPERVLFVGVTREAPDHPQNLVRQLHDYLELLTPGGSATLLLTDRSDRDRFHLK